MGIEQNTKHLKLIEAGHCSVFLKCMYAAARKRNPASCPAPMLMENAVKTSIFPLATAKAANRAKRPDFTRNSNVPLAAETATFL